MNTQDNNTVLSKYQDKGFNKHQLEQIAFGIERGLGSEQVDVYAKPEFNQYQMCQIRVGYENGLTHEQVAVFATSQYSEAQMCELRVAFELDMSAAEVSELAHPELSWQEMWRKRVEMRESAGVHVSLGEAIVKAEAMKQETGAPEHYKQENLEL